MAIGDVFKAVFVGQAQFGQELVNTFHYEQLTPLLLADPMDELAAALQLDMIPKHADCRSVATQLDKIEVRGVTDPTIGRDFPLVTPVSGTQSGDALPPQSAVVMTWTTPFLGRRFRGRTYMWPGSEGAQASGVINSGYVTAMSDWGTSALQIGDGLTTAVFRLVVRSDTYNLNTPATGFVVRTNIATQRRRRAGVGS